MSVVYFLNLAVNGLVQGLVIALAALALNLVFAVGRFPNAATGDFMTVGAYAGIAVQGLGSGSILLDGLGAVAACCAVALASHWLVFSRLAQRSMVASLIAAIGIAFFMRSVLTFAVGFEQHVFNLPIVRGLNFGGVRIVPSDIYLGLACLGCLVLVFCVLHLTPLGRRMRAVADNQPLARASGINVRRVMISLWLLVGLVCGVAGMVLGVKTVVTPMMGWNILLPAFAAAVLGGVGSTVGAVVAGIALGILQELSTPFVGFTYKIALSFVILMAVLVIRPEGLFGSRERVR